MTDEQLAILFPQGSRQGESKVLYRIPWACTHLKIIDALDNSQRGVWSITQKGLDHLEMDRVEEALKSANKAVARERRKARAESQSEHVEDDEELAEGDDDGGEDWKGKLLGVLKAMEPGAFERLSMRLVKEAGFRNVEVLGKSNDGGIDGVGVYKVSLVSFPTYFRCKRYAGSVPSGAVRDFRGAMSGRGEKGILMTTGTFTREAKAEAVRDGAPPVDLIGGDDLCDLLLEYGIGVRVRVRTVKDITVDQGFFEDMSGVRNALAATAAFRTPRRDTPGPSAPADSRGRAAGTARRSVLPRRNPPAWPARGRD